MPVAEGAPLHVLAGQAHVVPLDEKGPERHGLREAPVDVDPRLGRLDALLEDLRHLAVQLEALGHLPGLHADVAEHVGVHAGRAHAAVLAGGLETLPLAAEPVARLRLVRLTGLVFLLVVVEDERADLLRLVLGHRPLVDQPPLVNVERGLVLLYRLVQDGLGEARLIELVVPKPPVADHVDDDVGPPLVSPLDRELERTRDGDGVVSVDVKDRRVEGLAEVRCVGRGAAVDGVRGEADLVVDDHVDGPPDVEVLDARHLHRLVDHALAGERGVAVEQNRDDVPHVLRAVSAVDLLRPGLPEDHGVDALEMRGVGDEAEMDLASVGIGALHAGPEVVLDVARAAPVLRVLHVLLDVEVRPLELAEYLVHRLPHHVRENVHTAPVGHPDDEAVRAQLRRPVDGALERRHDGLASVEPETLRGVELVRQEGLERVGEA
mmetsp:Transcript_6060/g.13931  ORF Transcript_6060/g.13931 Transcript_6060/m.13931 type:complete len:436 (+) Transcript_6060:1097-2404(+)